MGLGVRPALEGQPIWDWKAFEHIFLLVPRNSRSEQKPEELTT
jgi:hypothetical protein